MTDAVMVTGHRDLRDDSWRWVEAELHRVLRKLADGTGVQACIHGAALGADLLFAETAIGLTLPVITYVPYPGQADRWDADQAARRDRVLGASLRVQLVEPRPIASRGDIVRALHARNDAMIRDSNVTIAVLDRRTSGGSYSTTQKALRAGNRVLRINPDRRTTSIIKELR